MCVTHTHTIQGEPDKLIYRCPSISRLRSVSNTHRSAEHRVRSLCVTSDNTWDPLPKLPFCFVQGPKHAPVINDRYVVLMGAQRRLSARRGLEPPGYLGKQGRFDIGKPNDVVQYLLRSTASSLLWQSFHSGISVMRRCVAGR
jgi:hypothetical protein